MVLRLQLNENLRGVSRSKGRDVSQGENSLDTALVKFEGDSLSGATFFILFHLFKGFAYGPTVDVETSGKVLFRNRVNILSLRFKQGFHHKQEFQALG